MWDGQMPRGNWMPDPRDGKCGKMPHYCPGGGGEWALLELTDALQYRPIDLMGGKITEKRNVQKVVKVSRLSRCFDL